MYATSLLIKFLLQFCYGYTEQLYTYKSYHLALYHGYSKFIIIELVDDISRDGPNVIYT